MDHLKETAAIVSGYVTNNPVPQAAIPALIRSVHTSLAGLARYAVADRAPAVPVKKSITADWIVCLECGRPLKTMRRHLRSRHSLTIAEYRARWGLPFCYPVTAKSYAAQRSEYARKNGLGRHRAEEDIA